MSSQAAPDVVVVGGGAIGVTVALELARRGAAVHLLEAGPRTGNGCSFANAGLLVPSHVEPLASPGNVRTGLRYMHNRASPFYLAPRPSVLPWLMRFLLASTSAKFEEGRRHLSDLAMSSLQMHADYAAAGLHTGFRRSGMLDAFKDPRAFQRARAHALSSPSSLPVEVLDSDGVALLEPALGEVDGGLYFQQEGFCDSRLYVSALARRATEEGAVIRTGVAVEGLKTTGDRIIALDTSAGLLPTEQVVVAAGMWSPELVRGTRIALPMQAGTGYVIDLEPGPGDPKIPVSYSDRKVVATPYRDRLRLCGTLELSGLNPPLDRRRIHSVIDAAAQLLPRLGTRRYSMVWAGQRPCTPDGLPVIGRARQYANLILATGHGQSGLILAPGTARLVANEVTVPGGDVEAEAFSPNRFSRLLPRDWRASWNWLDRGGADPHR